MSDVAIGPLVTSYYQVKAIRRLFHLNSVAFISYLAGDIGGTMGLFLGASFLSVVEIVDFVFTHLTRKKKTSQDPVKKIFL